MTVKLITFKTSQTVMADVDNEWPDGPVTTADKAATIVTLKKPVQVIVQPTKEGPMMGFAPFLDYAEEFNTGIEISKADILCVTTPSRELENQYNKVFGSNIEIASFIPKV
jgi:hypothetical protein